MKRRLAIVFPNLGLGGVQRRMVDIANYISDSAAYNNTTTSIIVKQLGEFNFKEQLKKTARTQLFISTNYFKNFKPNNVLFLLYTNWILLTKIRPTTVLVFFHYSVLSVLLYKIGNWNTKLVVSQDNILSLYNRKPHVNRVYPKWLIQILYWFVDVILVQTHTAKRDLVEYISVNPDKVNVIPNWASKEIPKKIPTLSERKYDLLYAGRFAAQKRLDIFIEFCALMVNHLPNLKVILIGEGPEEITIQRLIRVHSLEKNISILPPTKKQEQFLLQSKFLLLTSEFEGHPMILTEAMSLGVVPLVLNYPGCVEYVRNTIDAIVDTSLELLAHRTLEFYSNKKKAQLFSEQVAKSAQSRFNHTLLMEETLELLLQ